MVSDTAKMSISELFRDILLNHSAHDNWHKNKIITLLFARFTDGNWSFDARIEGHVINLSSAQV